jgi:ABC-type multidrug transport system ATPase subunit
VQPVLSIQNISKSYKPIQALKNVSFDVPEGSVFGILGPNGSGKTTMLGTILDVLKADAGSYQWFGGMNAADARKQIGAILETPNFYPYLSAIDNLEVAAAIKQNKLDDKLDVLKKVDLLARKDSKFQTYSLGMKQRLAIASALLGKPKVLIFDEPTNGLDPAGIAEIRELIKQLHSEGYTIIMASHLLDEVEKVCTHVAILKKGELLLTGPVTEVLLSKDTIEVKAADISALQQVLQNMPGIKEAKLLSDSLVLVCDDVVTSTAVNQYCISKGIILSHLAMKKKSLETKFMELTN